MEVWLVMECMSSLVESESVSVSFGLEQVEFCNLLVSSLTWLDSLDTVGAGELGLDSDEVSAFGMLLISLYPYLVVLL